MNDDFCSVGKDDSHITYSTTPDDVDPAKLLHELVQSSNLTDGESPVDAAIVERRKPGRPPGGKRRDYTIADHKRAYEIWRQSGNMRHTSRTMGVNWHLVNRWSQSDYRCKWSCPWHNWEELRKRDMLRMDKIANTNDAMIWKSNDDGVLKTPADVEDLIRSDKERLLHLELLYNKLFFIATEILLDCPALKNASGKMTPQELRELFARGAQTRSLDVATKTLLNLIQEMDRLKEQAGLKRKQGRNGEAEKAIPKLPIEELRKLQSGLAKMDESERNAFAKLWHNDIDILQSVPQDADTKVNKKAHEGKKE